MLKSSNSLVEQTTVSNHSHSLQKRRHLSIQYCKWIRVKTPATNRSLYLHPLTPVGPPDVAGSSVDFHHGSVYNRQIVPRFPSNPRKPSNHDTKKEGGGNG